MTGQTTIFDQPVHAKLTQHEKIISQMCRNRNKKWWLATDFMEPGLGELFVGYEASARLTELVKSYPDVFETRQEGRFRAVRMRFETGSMWFHSLPVNLKKVINKYLRKE